MSSSIGNPASKVDNAKNVIILKLRSYDFALISDALHKLRMALDGTGVEVCGPIPMPVKIKTMTVLRSPHIDKKSREHFEMRTHSRVLYLYLANCTGNILDILAKVILPAGVEIKIKYNR